MESRFKQVTKIAICFSLLACFAAFLCPCSAAFAGGLSDSELEEIASMMEERGMGMLVGSELLLDRHGNPSFAMGRSKGGYIIVDRATRAFMEQGSGAGPYSERAVAKYYGGLMCYAEDDGSGLVNIVTGEATDSIPYCPSAEAYLERMAKLRVGESSGGAHGTRLSPVVDSGDLTLQEDKIKRVAFGLNAASGEGAINNSCTAVALTIALNYLDYSFDGNLVDSNMELETLASTGYLNSAYQNATRFHAHLVNDCGLGPLLGELGMWGPFVVSGIGSYLGRTQARSEVGLGFDWTVINTGWIEGSIDKNVPALITIALSSWENGGYNNHTMVAYGYRKFSDGAEEINLHSGWYGSGIVEGGIASDYYMGDLWAPSGVADMTYCFELSDGWHCCGAGDWKYYDDEEPVTGWQTIGGSVYYFGFDGVRVTGWLPLNGNMYHLDSNGVMTTGYYVENGVRYYFGSDGALISQVPLSSPFTGPADGMELDALQVAHQERLQRTTPGRIPEALARAMGANPDVIAWLHVPGTSVSVPVARREGDAGYYLSHDSLGNESPIGCAFTSGDGGFGDAVTVVYGHSFSSGDLAFTSLHAFGDYGFFRDHEEAWLYLPGRRVEYRVVGANLFNSRAIEGVDQSDPADLADYFAELGDPDPAAFVGYKRDVRLDPSRDRLLQLSTCTVPADPAHRFVVTCVLVGEEEL